MARPLPAAPESHPPTVSPEQNESISSVAYNAHSRSQSDCTVSANSQNKSVCWELRGNSRKRMTDRDWPKCPSKQSSG